ncbi:MAG: hypothetical protein IJC73_07160 [Lentisphaeria bacterium]|nr:hypothetical protein [Lentisphaeria bacterium]
MTAHDIEQARERGRRARGKLRRYTHTGGYCRLGGSRLHNSLLRHDVMRSRNILLTGAVLFFGIGMFFILF